MQEYHEHQWSLFGNSVSNDTPAKNVVFFVCHCGAVKKSELKEVK